jgi:hypothetical protein
VRLVVLTAVRGQVGPGTGLCDEGRGLSTCGAANKEADDRPDVTQVENTEGLGVATGQLARLLVAQAVKRGPADTVEPHPLDVSQTSWAVTLTVRAAAGQLLRARVDPAASTA